MRRAFTLLELLTAVGIMAMLGVAASGGYRALARGMRERSAVSAVSAALRAARERALVDREKTVVFCYNRLVRKPNAKEDVNGIVVGVVTAIRRGGRISGLSGELLYDEFTDLDRVYEGVNDEAECARHKGLRLFRFQDDMKYSIVSDAVFRDDKKSAYLPSDGVEPTTPNLTLPAFYNLKKSQHEPTWKVGDEYAFEFLDVELPQGFVFGQSSIPTDFGKPELVQRFVFDPANGAPDVSIKVYFAEPNEAGVPTVRGNAAGEAKSDSDNV